MRVCVCARACVCVCVCGEAVAEWRVAGGELDLVRLYSSVAGSIPSGALFLVRAPCISTTHLTPNIMKQQNAPHSTATRPRDRSSPACTLSQNGYGTEAHVSNQHSKTTNARPNMQCLSNARRTPDIIEERHTKQTTAKGLRDRSRPTCTSSQHGYGPVANVSHHVMLFVISAARAHSNYWNTTKTERQTNRHTDRRTG